MALVLFIIGCFQEFMFLLVISAHPTVGLLFVFVHSITQSVMVQNLDPNTRYEFVVRLHVDQISSPWSSVVYHRTLPAGNKLDITISLFFHDYCMLLPCLIAMQTQIK